MLSRIIGGDHDLYAVYYVVYGSLAGEGYLVKEYFWAGPYKYMKDAFKEAQELKISHQDDDSFVVRNFKE